MRIFRYFDRQGALATLQSRNLRFADPRNFNDPFEFTPRMIPPSEEEVLATYSSEWAIRRFHNQEGKAKGWSEEQSAVEYEKRIPDKVRNAMEDMDKKTAQSRCKLLDFVAQNFRLLCGSHTHESVLMWSHYAEKHQGLVLEFESNELVKGVCLDQYTFDVVYRTSPPLLPPMLLWTDEQWLESIEEITRTKAIFWNYEEEVRLLWPLGPGVGPGVLPPPHFDLAFEPSAVKSVILGYRADDVFIDNVAKLVEDPDFLHVECVKAHIHERDYKLSFTSLAPAPLVP